MNLVLNATQWLLQRRLQLATTPKTEDFLTAGALGSSIVGAHTLEEFRGALSAPRRILMMIPRPAEPIDAMIATLTPLLEDGDLA